MHTKAPRHWLLLVLICCISLPALARTPLPVDKAFTLTMPKQTSNSISLHWQIAPGYYLYKDRIHIQAAPADQILIGRHSLPEGLEKIDDILGVYQVFQHRLQLDIPIDIQPDADTRNLEIIISYQGCADDGYCYPPVAKRIHWPENFDMPMIETDELEPDMIPVVDYENIETILESREYFFILTTFLGFGLLLAFTPCVLPMLPILSGLVLGRGKHFSHGKAFFLAFTYVLGMASTYALAGVLASWAGQQVQSLLQQPWLIATFSSLFVALALSLFGLYELRLPSRLQNYLNQISSQQTAGSTAGVFIMGVLSALLVSPCITPPLVGALTYMGNTGDVVLGGSALFVMGLGMGIPLILFVTVGSKLLPKSGPWMIHVEHFFAVMLLGVAIWLLERILPGPITLMLWGGLCTLAAVLLGVFRNVRAAWGPWLAKAFGIVIFCYANLLFAGGLLGSNDPLQPLQGSQSAHLNPFERIKTIDDLTTTINVAKAQSKLTFIDFYADWCVACKMMEKHAFADPDVNDLLKRCFVATQADITKMDPADRALQQHLNVIAPPTLVFFDRNGVELSNMRLVGEMDTQGLLAHLQKMTGSSC